MGRRRRLRPKLLRRRLRQLLVFSLLMGLCSIPRATLLVVFLSRWLPRRAVPWLVAMMPLEKSRIP